MKSTMKKSVVGACIAALSPIGLLAASPLAHGSPTSRSISPMFHLRATRPSRIVTSRQLRCFCRTSKWTCQRDRAFRLIP